MRMLKFAPLALVIAALACSKDFRVPGTRIASPNVVKMTLSRSAISTHSSIRDMGRTQTGQPGP